MGYPTAPNTNVQFMPMRLAIGPPNKHKKPTKATKSVGHSPDTWNTVSE